MTDQQPELPPFTYSPLAPGSIRLLLPDPSGEPSGHTWSLQTVSLASSDLQFDALSYVWGAQDEVFPIILDGRRSHVHQNLHTALPYLTRRGDCNITRPIWIDAICINQVDEEEKMTQIQLMNRIYRQAAKVWAWLGISEHQEKIPEAIALLVAFSDLRGNWEEPSISDEEMPTVLRTVDLDRWSPADWSALTHLINNDWYRRLWVVQEAALAQDLAFLCGDHEIACQQMEDVLHESHHLSRVRYVDFQTRDIYSNIGLFSIRETVQEVQEMHGRGLLSSELVMVSRWVAYGQTCLRPEDRVLGILGMTDEWSVEIAGMNFHQHSSISALYTRFATMVLGHSDYNNEWWKWLGMAFAFNRNEDLPSWVPDLHHQAPADTSCPCRQVSDYKHEEDRQYQASRIDGDPSFQGPDCVVLHGKILDTVVLVCPEVPKSYMDSFGQEFDLESWRESAIEIGEWEGRISNSILMGEVERNEKRICLETYWRTLLGNDTSVNRGPITGEWYKEFRTAVEDIEDVLQRHAVNEK